MLPSRSRRIPVDQQLAAAQRLQQLHRPPPPAAPGWVPDPLAEPLHAAVPGDPGVPGRGWEPVPPVAPALDGLVPVPGPEPGGGGPPSAPRAAAPYGPEVAAAVSAGGTADFPRSEPAGGRHRAPASAPASVPVPAPVPVPVPVPAPAEFAGPGRLDTGTAFLQAEPSGPHRQADPLRPLGLADRGPAFDEVPPLYDTAPTAPAPPAPPALPLALEPPMAPATPAPTIPATVSGPVPELRDRLADLLPPWSRTAVVAPSWRAVLALGLVGLFAVLLTAGAMWRARPHVSAVGAVPAVSVSTPAGRPAAAGSPPPSAGARPALVVAVAGKVRHPGVVRLAAGARVQDAVRAAGGVSPGASLGLLNLARPVVDGEQILVGVSGAAASPAAPGPGPSGGSGGTGAVGAGGAPVDLKTATESDLEQLPGVGPVLAQRILDWRTAHGSFTSVDQLRQVSGIGDKKFADLRPQVRV